MNTKKIVNVITGAVLGVCGGVDWVASVPLLEKQNIQ